MRVGACPRYRWEVRGIYRDNDKLSGDMETEGEAERSGSRSFESERRIDS
jgi:hypothetical protein